MKIYLSGNPLNKRKDNIPIYTDACYMPSTQPWEKKLSINTADASIFIENLYFVTMEANGFCYFYPNLNTKIKLCRFERHYDFRGKDYFLRVGFCFKEGLTGVFDFEYYIQTHEQFKDLTTLPQNEFSITKEENETIISFIQQQIDIAISRIVTKPVKLFNIISLASESRDIKKPSESRIFEFDKKLYKYGTLQAKQK